MTIDTQIQSLESVLAELKARKAQEAHPEPEKSIPEREAWDAISIDGGGTSFRGVNIGGGVYYRDVISALTGDYRRILRESRERIEKDLRERSHTSVSAEFIRSLLAAEAKRCGE